MNCRFLFVNPQNVGVYFSIKVQAYGGTKTATNLYGNKLMGQWQFADIFATKAGTWTNSNTYTSTLYKVPSKSPWRDQTIHYAFSRNDKIGSRRTSLARFTLYDSGLSYTDKQICRAQLYASDSDDDLIELLTTINGRKFKYAYFVRTWPSITDLRITSSGWSLSYLKCKFYTLNYYGYFFFADNDADIVTLQYDSAHMTSLITAFQKPINLYLGVTNRVDKSNLGSYVIAQFDITDFLSSITAFSFENTDLMTLKMNWQNLGTQWWGTSVNKCFAIGGFKSSSPQNPVNCQVVNSKEFYFKNIAGFEADPYLGANSNIRIKFMFHTTSSLWYGSNDPFKSYINTDNVEEKIQCKCISGVGPLSSFTISVFIDATCRRRKPTTEYNAYAIILDHQVNKNQNLRCYFPEFYISENMEVQAEVKRIYGMSYLPDIYPETSQYGGIFRTKTNKLSFLGTTPTMPISQLSAVDGSYYSTTINVGSIYADPYTLTASWSTTYSSPYLYVNCRKAGPVSLSTFCSDSTIYNECRAYSTLINLVIGKLKSTSATSFSLSSGASTVHYPSSKFSISSEFDGVIYVGSSTWQVYGTLIRSQTKLVPISTNIFNVMPNLYRSNKSGFSTILLFSMSIQGNTLYNYFLTKSKIQITYANLIQEYQCMVWVQNQPTVELTCETSNGVIIIYSYRTDYTTSNNIWVSLGITNPTASSWQFTMKLYDYYYSISKNSLVISKKATYTIDNSDISHSRIEKSRLQMYPFRARVSSIANTPLRIQFKLNGIDVSFQTPGKFSLTYPQFAYSSKYLCYFYEFQSYTNMIQRTQYTQFKVFCESVSDTLTVYPPKVKAISKSYFYELVIMPIGIDSTGCSQGCQSQSGFHQVNLQQLIFSAFYNYSAASFYNIQYTKLYAYEGPDKITLDSIFYLTNQPVSTTSIFFKFSLDFTSAVNYPNHYLQFILYDLTSADFSGYTINDIIPCQLSDTFTKIINRNDPQCRLSGVDSINSFVKLQIENFGPIHPEFTRYHLMIFLFPYHQLKAILRNSILPFSFSLLLPQDTKDSSKKF